MKKSSEILAFFALVLLYYSKNYYLTEKYLIFIQVFRNFWPGKTNFHF
jgi:hypothetical protein